MYLKFINLFFSKFDLKVVPLKDPLPLDIEADKDFMSLYSKVRNYTMTSPERLYSLYQSVIYTVKNDIPGDFVECGVWKGGSSMMMALTLMQLGVTNRNIYLYDTFEGMPMPEDVDKQYDGESANMLLDKSSKQDSGSVWCISGIDEVKRNVLATGYPSNLLHFVKGKVEDTIPVLIPAIIGLLRLDTDWYSSTKHEMEHLYPLLSSKGILIIDDFGHWEGAKKAILEYFENIKSIPSINRIDYTGRLIIKD